MITVVAQARLQRMVAMDQDPVLTATEIDDLLLIAQEVDFYGNSPDYTWFAESFVPVGVYIKPTAGNGHHYRVRTAGVTGDVEPAWPVGAGATVNDGTVVWQEAGAPNWNPTYDLERAAAEGWRWKAGKAASRYNFASDNAQFDRGQVYTHCEAMANIYAKKAGSKPRSVRSEGNLVVDRGTSGFDYSAYAVVGN